MIMIARTTAMEYYCSNYCYDYCLYRQENFSFALEATRRFVADEEMLSVPADAIISEGAAGQSYQERSCCMSACTPSHDDSTKSLEAVSSLCNCQASHWTLAVAHRLVEEDGSVLWRTRWSTLANIPHAGLLGIRFALLVQASARFV